MRYGMEVINLGDYADPRPVIRLAQAAEAAGLTWWLESLNGLRGSMDEMLGRAKTGPPR